MTGSENILLAFSLTLFAGLATGVGSIMAFFSKKFNPKFLAGGSRIFRRCHDICLPC